MYGRGACADFTLRSAARINTNPIERSAALRGQLTDRVRPLTAK